MYIYVYIYKRTGDQELTLLVKYDINTHCNFQHSGNLFLSGFEFYLAVNQWEGFLSLFFILEFTSKP